MAMACADLRTGAVQRPLTGGQGLGRAEYHFTEGESAVSRKYPMPSLLGVKGLQVHILSSRLETVVDQGPVSEKSETGP